MRKVILNNKEYYEEDGIYNPVEKESSYEEKGGTCKLEDDGMLYPTFNFIVKRRTRKNENYGMLHTTFLSMKYLEIYKELEKENKLDERRREIRQRVIEFIELETPRYMKAWGVTNEMKIENQNEWVKLMNQIDMIIDEQIKHMIVYSL